MDRAEEECAGGGVSNSPVSKRCTVSENIHASLTKGLHDFYVE